VPAPVALVTAARKGLGAACVHELAARDCRGSLRARMNDVHPGFIDTRSE
jgi:hypothetical protein